MPLGIVQSALDPDRPAGSFQMARAAGADGIELTCGKDAHARALLGADEAAGITKLKKKFSLEVSSIALSMLAKTESLFGGRAVASAAAELIRKAMSAARLIGAGVVVLPFLGKAGIESEAELDRTIEALREPAEEAEELGLTLGIVSNLNVNQQLSLLDHLAEYDSVRICYDTGQIFARKLDPATALRDLGRDRICQIRLRDVHLTEANPPDWEVALGAGDVDFGAIAKAITAMDYAGWVVLETPATDKPSAAAKANLKFARELLGQR